MARNVETDIVLLQFSKRLQKLFGGAIVIDKP
jgi:hypothetical protein